MKVKKSVFAAMILMLFQNTVICQQLKVGDQAPYFEMIDARGDLIHLNQYKGRKVLVAFFRYAGCPVCNFRLNDLIENYESIQSKGYSIIAVYESDNIVLKEYLSVTAVPFPVIGDPQLALYQKYGLEKSLWKVFLSVFRKQTKEAKKKGNALFRSKIKRDGYFTRLPADFIIDAHGRITAVHYGLTIGDHLPLQEILND